MKKLLSLLGAFVLIGLLAGTALAGEWPQRATPSPAATTAVATASPTPIPTFTRQPTYTPRPTYTPLPTYTPRPTYTPLPTFTPPPLPMPYVPPPTLPPLPALPPMPGGGVQFGGEEGRVVFGGSYVLPAGERLGGDLVIFGGMATLEQDSRVDGNVSVIGGMADISGRIDRDLVMIGGTANLRDGANIRGCLVRVGGAVQRDEGAVVRCETTTGPMPPVVVPRIRPMIWWWDFDPLDLISNTFGAFLSTLVMAALAVLLVAVWPIPTTRAMRAVAEAAPLSWLVGALTIVVVTFALLALTVLSGILVLVCIGVFGLLLTAILAVAFAAAGLYGWLVVGTLIGQRLLELLGVKNASLVGAAALGTASITLLVTLLFAIPCTDCLGALAILILAPAGLGAVILTRFGTQTYMPGIAPSRPVPSAPPIVPAPPEPPFKPTPPSEPEAPAALLPSEPAHVEPIPDIPAPGSPEPAPPVEPKWPDITPGDAPPESAG